MKVAQPFIKNDLSAEHWYVFKNNSFTLVNFYPNCIRYY